MKTGILIWTALVVILSGTVAYAAEKNDVAPVNFAGQGEWIGVIEDVQDIDDSKWAEFQTKWKIPNAGRTVGLAIGYNIALATGQAMQVYTWANIFDRRISGHSRLRDDPRTFQIFFKQNDGTVQSVVVHDQQLWEVGDKVKTTSDGVKTTVETIEMGELSRYKAERAAKLSGK